MSAPHFLRPLLGEATASLTLSVVESGATLARTLVPAFDSASRNRGLLGRSAWPDDTALVLAPCQAVHTCFMRFPLDVVFVERDGRVVKLREGLVPWRVSGSVRAFAVIELAPGGIRGCGLRPGHHLRIVRA
ncbi:MAG: DUF192 domain-containing protein [Vicinamibacterales bacterium]